MKGTDALVMEPPVLMHFFQFAINALEIVLSDHPFVFFTGRTEKQPLRWGKKQAELIVTSVLFPFQVCAMSMLNN